MSKQWPTRHFRGLEGLPPPVLKILRNVPRAGGGVHWWLLPAAGALKPYRDSEAIKTILRSLTVGCGRFVTDHELEDAIRNGRPLDPSHRDHGERGAKTWPQPDREAQQHALRAYEGFDLADFESVSHWPQWGRETSFDFMWALYHQRALLCCGPSLVASRSR